LSELSDALRELEAATQRVRDAASHTLTDVAAKVNEVVGEFDSTEASGTANPDGTVTNSDGSVTHPDGTVVHADGSRTMPDGTRTDPNGNVVPQ
jgi:hypothetical protein